MKYDPYEVPEVLQILKNQLIENWNEYDLNRKALAKKRRDEIRADKVKYPARMADYYLSKSDINILYKSDNEIKNENEKKANFTVAKLYYQVKEKVGNIYGWDYIRLQNHLLSGQVHGDKGSVYVETIYAGGYNIQKLHFRTLIKSI